MYDRLLFDQFKICNDRYESNHFIFSKNVSFHCYLLFYIYYALALKYLENANGRRIPAIILLLNENLLAPCKLQQLELKNCIFDAIWQFTDGVVIIAFGVVIDTGVVGTGVVGTVSVVATVTLGDDSLTTINVN